MTSTESLNTSPPLYNQPMLIKGLESLGIGRPSTYANLLKKIIDYKYVKIDSVVGFEKQLLTIDLKNDTITQKTKKTTIGGEKSKLLATDLGEKVVQFLNKNFTKLMDYKFTSDMENKLDLIANNELKYKNVLNEFYTELNKSLINTKSRNTIQRII
jgi:DNA topoisomerase-1